MEYTSKLRIKRFIVVIAIGILAISLSGCGGTKINDLPTVAMLSHQELIDYSKEDIKHTASYESRSKVPRVVIDKVEVSDKSKILKLTKAYEVVEQDLYNGSYHNSMALNRGQFEFIKYYIDDKALIKNEVLSIEGGSGLYFVDVEYKTSPISTGSIGDQAKYLGIHGVFVETTDGNLSIDQGYLGYLNNKLYEHELTKQTERAREQIFSNKVNTEVIEEGQEFEEENQVYENEAENIEENLGENIVNTIEENVENNIVEETEVGAEINVEAEVENMNINTETNYNIRKPILNVREANEVAGSSRTQTAIMPNLFSIYSPPSISASIAGYGIFPQGAFGLSEFNYDRNKASGTLVLRYVFREDLRDTTIINFETVYPVKYELDKNTIKNSNNVVAESISVEIGKIIERADRAIMNNDITALMGGKIYADMGAGILQANRNKNNHILGQYSKVVDIVGKKGTKYLAEVDVIIEEGIKDSVIVKYNNKYYILIEQHKEEFIINDFVCIKSELIEEPELIIESPYIKRLIALSSGGNVSNANKKAIENLMQELYTGSTERILKDMYKCFNDDEKLLTADHREYLNSRLRGWLVKEGSNTKAVHEGKIVSWISGSDNQAEIVTEEKITYIGKDKEQKMQLYYLVSNYNNKWVIDDIKIIELQE